MNVRIECSSSFSAGIVWQDRYMINNFLVSVKLITQTMDATEQNIALERLKYMVYSQFQHGVFVSEKDKTWIKKLQTAGLKVFVLPTETVDQIVGMLLYCKLNAVMENRLGIMELSISSDLGDSIIYYHNENESIGPFSVDGWWHSSDPTYTEVTPTKGKVVELSPNSSWQSLGLEWQTDDKEEPVDTNKIVLAFKKDD
jgi:hypothetical protein